MDSDGFQWNGIAWEMKKGPREHVPEAFSSLFVSTYIFSL